MSPDSALGKAGWPPKHLLTSVTAHLPETEPQGPSWRRVWSRHLAINLGPVPCFRKMEHVRETLLRFPARKDGRAGLGRCGVCMAGSGRKEQI